MDTAYRDDLAYIHDAGFGYVALHAAEELREALQRRVFTHGRVIDLGCGSGILSQKLAEAGYDVLGIDFSPAMIELARRRVPQAGFQVGSFVTADIPDCIAVAAVGECFNYLFDEGNRAPVLRKVFRRVFEALSPGGLFLIDMAGPGRVPGRAQQSQVTGADWVVMVTAVEDRKKILLTRQITSFRQVGELFRQDQEEHRLRLYRPAEIAQQLRQVGFKVRLLSHYNTWSFPRGWRGFLARKPD